MKPTIWKIVPFLFTFKKIILVHFSNFCREFYIMTELTSLCTILTTPSSASPQYIQIKAKSTFYELWTLHLFSGKAVTVTESREEQLQNLYSLPDTYSVTKSWRIRQIRQNTNEVYEKFIQNLCSNI
jgi:hypothetical protein